MPLFASIECEGLELSLPDTVLNGYRFSYVLPEVSYAKTRPEIAALHIEIDVTELLSNDLAALEESEEMLENLRAWGQYIFGVSEPAEQYYRRVKLTHTQKDEVFRELVLSHAYVERLVETYDLGAGKHTMMLELSQKEGWLAHEW